LNAAKLSEIDQNRPKMELLRVATPGLCRASCKNGKIAFEKAYGKYNYDLPNQ